MSNLAELFCEGFSTEFSKLGAGKKILNYISQICNATLGINLLFMKSQQYLAEEMFLCSEI